MTTAVLPGILAWCLHTCPRARGTDMPGNAEVAATF